MTKSSIGALLNVHEEIEEVEVLLPSTEIVDVKETTKKLKETTKVEFAENNIKEIISQSMKTIPNLVRDLQYCEDPKMYTAASNFIETLVNVNTQYANMDSQPTEKEKKGSQPKNVTNNLVLMSTSDVLDSI